MKREIRDVCPGIDTDFCCPGHDTWPCEAYNNRRSIRRRAKDKKKEHRYVRRVKKHKLRNNEDID